MTELAASFAELELSQGTLDILAQRNYTTPTPIQAMVIPRLLTDGSDLIAQAQTGTGKTAAYALRCVCYAIYQATSNALKSYPGLEVVFSGGVASNSMLREKLVPLNPVFSKPEFSTDNAMGVAVLAHRLREA